MQHVQILLRRIDETPAFFVAWCVRPDVVDCLTDVLKFAADEVLDRQTFARARTSLRAFEFDAHAGSGTIECATSAPHPLS